MTYVTASDGLPARVVHQWSDEKLFYTERYMDIFTTGMKNRWDNLVYADFFAGPGRCVVEESGEESEGSPLRAIRYGFSSIFLNDYDRVAVDALRERTRGEDRVHITQLDCNAAVDEAIDFLIPQGARRKTLGLAFIDPTAYQMRFDSIRRLTARGRFDLLVTFMTNYGTRFISRPGFGEGSDFARFIGPEAYDKHVRGRSIRTYQLLQTYREQLGKIGYGFVDDVARIPSEGQAFYHLVFASHSSRGREFFKKIRERTPVGQRRMDLS